jgi:hypothetical protein
MIPAPIKYIIANVPNGISNARQVGTESKINIESKATNKIGKSSCLRVMAADPQFGQYANGHTLITSEL